MDCSPIKERDVVIDIERCIETSQEVEVPSLSDDKIEHVVSITICGVPMNVDTTIKGEILVSPSKNVDEVSPDKAKNNSNSNKREKRKSNTAKKPPKPPRLAKGLSLDAADQKLIKEISELAMIKRARIERMKALKKMKAAKASSLSASTSGNLIAMLFTVIFCIVVIFQGCHSGISHRNRSDISIPGPQQSNGVAGGDIIVVQGRPDLSNSGVPLTSIGSPEQVKLVPGSNSKVDSEKAID